MLQDLELFFHRPQTDILQPKHQLQLPGPERLALPAIVGASTSSKQQGTVVPHLIQMPTAHFLPHSQALPGAVQLSLTL